MTGDRDTFIFLIETGIAHYRLKGEKIHRQMNGKLCCFPKWPSCNHANVSIHECDMMRPPDWLSLP